ncbi:hypothetical protein E6B08_22975 [Pseudomonas putida]|uniref:Uncharacterized protein n=1 Tax=Pseudomonas putida TaxID=303 RepID=A0A4D6XIV2_PSEPU|nr:hypothetical protein [Pseudomonas putida]QCI14031.1 hypothetical protein E6B08_22975 [Pseudomonas putida]
MLKVRLDGRRLISTYQIILPPGARGEIDIVIGTDFAKKEITLPLSIMLQSGGENQNVTFANVGGRSLMTLHNWSTMGTALTSLYELAQVEDYGVVEMMMVNRCVGVTNDLTIQLWWRDVK